MLGTMTQMQQRRASIEARYTCKYCHKVFVKESAYLVHQCKQMKREEELKTPQGQAAWHYYSLWLRAQKRLPPPASSFLTSKFFRTFMNFVQFTKNVEMPKPDKFINLMVRKDYPPTMWTNDDVYVMYIEYLDRQLNPIEQFKISLDCLLSVSDKHDVDVADVFTVLKAQEIIQKLRTRQLSPWLLLNSKKFKILYRDQLTSEQRILIDQLIRPEFWGEKLEQYAEEVKNIRKVISEMGI